MIVLMLAAWLLGYGGQCTTALIHSTRATYLLACQKLIVKFQHVKGRLGDAGNDKADKLTDSGAQGTYKL